MKKFFKIMFSIILSIVLSLALYFRLSNREFFNNFFDMSILRVCSGSMESELQIGDIIVIKSYDNYDIGDIITYLDNSNTLITHRIIEKKDSEFVTKGDNNNVKDEDVIKVNDIKGKVICNSKILKFIYNKWIYIILIIILLYLIF